MGLSRGAARTRRVGFRTAAGLSIMLASVVGGVAVWAARGEVAVVAAASRLQPGEVIKRQHLRRAVLPKGSRLRSIPASSMEDVVGRVAREPLYPGKLLTPEAVSGEPPIGRGEVAMTLALEPEQAMGGSLRGGDLVQVLGTPQGIPGPAGSVIVLPGAVVLWATPSPDAGGGKVLVALRIPSEDAPRLAAAYRGGTVDLVLLGR
ncbi:MAG: RcpC/CpaB family pilus assembly protein [Actinomycetota bacterium]